jgi:quercetin dioxygenase-like cupin family protein
MELKMADANNITTRNISELSWQEFPGHVGGALSKPIVNAELAGAKNLTHTISSYLPGAYSESHSHATQEQIFHVLEGEGLLTSGGEKRLMRAHDVAFIPPGVEHGIQNSGLSNLVFLIITSPPRR